MTLPTWVRLVRAPNPGPMTLDGTNTWVLDGGDEQLVVDPGPDDERHRADVLAAAPRPVVALTHAHADHAEGAPGLAELTGASVRAVDAGWCRAGGEPLAADEHWAVGELVTQVLLTPGHTADSACLLARRGDEAVLVTGDTVLGRGTSVVAHPDGRVGDYLVSLRRLLGLGDLPVLPGHGPALPSSATVVSAYLDHRLARLAQVRAAVEQGARSADEVVDLVYGELAPGVRGAAVRTVRAQLAHLAETGRLPGAPGGGISAPDG